MADTQTSDPSLVAPVAVLPIQTVAWAATSLEKCEHEVIENLEASFSHLHEVTQSPHVEDSQQPSRDFSQSLGSDEAKIDSLEISIPAVIQHAVDSPFLSANTEITEKPKDNATEPNTEPPSSIPSTVSNSPVQQYAIAAHSLHAPQIKRFTSVNITKRFLEKTTSMSGSSLGTGSLSNTNSALISSSQHRGISPNSRSPSFDRPVSSRLVTAKLTAVPQPSSASTSGWLRPGQTTNSNTTPTPPSTSPQPPLHESTANSYQAIKRRSGSSPGPNGVPVSTGSQNSKPVWAKYTAPSSKPTGRNLPGLDNKSDFPTAAEAVHSMQSQSLRKGKSGKGQTEADTAAAAHKVAQQNAMNETAAAFRGTHLDANARWDEMSDEDSEDFDGVIEFGDGTQYKIEQKPNSSQGIPPERSTTPFEPDGPPVAKEERFGEDMGRNWPRQSELAVGQPSIDKPSLQLSVSSHPISEALNQTHSPHDGVSPTSRVLFNERLNRLEPLSESKAPFVPRQREPAFTSPTYSSNIQLLQKGLPGTDFKNRGPLRATGPGAERSPWGDGPPHRGPPSVKGDERSWESRRRESMSSATGSSIRDRSRGREKWVPHHTTGDRDNMQGALAPPTLTRERDGDRPNHLRPPLFTPMSPKGVEKDNFQSNFSAVSPTVSSQSFHSPVLEKSLLAASQPVENSEDVDKNVLLKSAMHLANERARRRKQESDEEERRREEGAERARKKAEALARAMEGKHESQTSSEPSTQLRSDEQTEAKTATAVSALSQKVSQEQLTRRPSADHSSAPPLLLSRKPTIPSVANQAESWRSRVPPKSVGTEMQSTEGKTEAKPDSQIASSLPPPPPDNSLVPSFPPASTNELLLKPDEEVEVVDFEDLGKFLGNAPLEPRALPKVLSKLSNRPVASDFFQDDTVEHEAKTEVLSWRRPTVKAQLTPSVDGLRTQTIPIFSTESSPETELPTMDPKNSQSPLLSPSKRLSQGDHVLNNSQISPVLSALRSPRASHFKEASMSALTDTMSRIKGALDGMQSHDILTTKDKGRQSAPEGWRTLHDGAPQRRPLTPEKLEEFVTCIPPPSSPKPVWKTHTVKIPRVCQIREPLQRKQVHYWNLPYPPFRWDILSWDPPVEGMNKRDLSRDEIFHKKNVLPKGGKLRVVLPPPNCQQAKIFQTSPKNISTDSTTLVTAMGIKIKLPNGPSTFRPVSTEHTQDVFNVSSWRGSAIPPTSLRNEQPRVLSVISNENLITISRSPPPEPSTPLPQLIPTKKEIPTSFEGPLAANVSLPSADIKALREPVSFLRTRDIVIREQTTSTRLPSFTVNSELEPFPSEPSDQAVKVSITNSSPGKTELKSLPSQAFTSAPHELPRLIASKPGSKSSEESATRPGTPPSSTPHTTSPWGKGLAFPVVKDSPTRRVPDPEHLKAVWSQPTSMPTGSTSNSLQDITDEQLPSIPSTVQDMKSEGGETPPPMIAPAPPTRLSQQEVARAFQQVPESPASRAPTYPQNSLFPQYHRPNHSMPLSHPARPPYPPYHPHAVMGHSPSPTLMYATGVDSPVLHPRLPVNGPSPSVANGVWLQTPPLPVTSQHGSYLRPAGAPPPPTQMVYPPSGAPNQMVPHRMAMMGHGSIPTAPPTMQAGSLYAPPQMPDMRNMQNMHMRSPHLAHTTPTHPHGVPMQTMHPAMFSPPPPPPPGHAGQPQTMYALPNGTNRGTMVPRGYESYHAMPPHAGYPTTPYMFPS